MERSSSSTSLAKGVGLNDSFRSTVRSKLLLMLRARCAHASIICRQAKTCATGPNEPAQKIWQGTDCPLQSIMQAGVTARKDND